MSQKYRQWESIYSHFCYFSLHMRINGIIFTFGSKFGVTIHSQQCQLPIKLVKFLWISKAYSFQLTVYTGDAVCGTTLVYNEIIVK